MTLATLPPLPGHLRALSDSAASRLLLLGMPQQNGLDDCFTCRGSKRFYWYADSTVQEPDTVAEYECNCRDQFRLSRNLFAAGIGKRQARMCWGDTLFAAEADLSAVLAYRMYFSAHLEQGTGLFMCGPEGRSRHGNGKSMFAALLAKQAIKEGKHAWFTTFTTMLDAYTAAWGDKEARIWFDQTVRAADLLVIDDIGKEHPGYSVAQPALDSIFRTRVQAGLVTLITTNLSSPVFQERYDTGLASLVAEACDTIEFQGRDFRTEARERLLREHQLGLTRPWTFD